MNNRNILTMGLANGFKECAGEPYRPSNGTEGDIFDRKWCSDCTRRKRCSIWDRALGLCVDDKGYPKQLVYGEDGQPKCTGHRLKGALPKRMRQQGLGLFDPKPERGL